jgi:arylsulfatase A-like enzyme
MHPYLKHTETPHTAGIPFHNQRLFSRLYGRGSRPGTALLGSLALLATDAMAARNILVLIADDLGADSSSLTNTTGPNVRLPETPNIDSLAQTGVVFPNTYARPSCSATRAALLTGRHAFRTGVGYALTGANSPALSPTEYTVPRAFAAQAPDYALAGIGKWHLGQEVNSPATRGGWPFYAGVNGPQPSSFTNWTKLKNGTSSNSTTYVTTDQVNEASEFITQQEAADRPWLVWVSFNAPHVPYHRPPAELLSPRFESLTGTNADITARRRDYFEALTEALDKEIGRLLTVVDRENTDIIYIGDNGTDNTVIQPPYKFAAENHAKFTVFEGGVRVPFVITGPSVKYSGRNETLVNVVDIFQLVQELAGIDVPATLPPDVVVDSKSIKPALESNIVIPSDVFVEQFNGGVAGGALRNERYKLIRFDAGTERFYDLQTDPYENTNLLTGTLSPEAQAHYHSLKRKFQLYLALPNGNLRVPFPFPAHKAFNVGGDSATLSYEYSQIRTSSVHTLWRTTDLNDPLAWVPIASRTVAAIPSDTPLATVSDSFTDPNATGGQYFYQVVPSRF